MQIEKCIIIFTLAIYNVTCFCQVKNKTELLERSKNYYNNLKVFSVNTLGKVKPPVAEDTSISRDRCIINNQTKEKLFLLPNKNYGIFIRGIKEYWVDLDSSIYRYTKGKDRQYTAYNRTYQFYPFVEIGEFFDRLNNKNLSFAETDKEFILSNSSYLCEFRKNNFSIKRVAEFGYDKKYKSSWYKETNFSECVENDTLAASYINTAVDIVSLANNEKEYWSKEKHIAPTTFDRSIFDNNNLNAVNYKGVVIKNKVIFLDFFYSSCIPCYKSHPLVNKLYENRDSNFLVVGIDPMLSDTLHIQQFLTRFDIKHPVIIGQDALEISRMPGIVNGYPTFLVVDLNGKVLEYWNGHSESFLKGIERKYLNKKSK
jgi:thiol-disulfide isomerase/thioredoxin